MYLDAFTLTSYYILKGSWYWILEAMRSFNIIPRPLIQVNGVKSFNTFPLKILAAE